MNDIEQNTFTVGFTDVDPSDRLKLSAVCDYFQEAAINHAEKLGMGRSAMAQTGEVWMLSRLNVLMERRPKYRETITVRSWPRGSEKLFAIRDYDILDENGKPIVRGRSGWLIVDIEKHRPLRPQEKVTKLPLNAGLDALPLLTNIGLRDGLKLAGERTPFYSDIDYNGHVNNSRYVQWIQDITEPDVLEKADRIRLDINYASETHFKETTELWAIPIENGFAYEGRRNGGIVFRAELGIFQEKEIRK
ncbi:MAG: acyl-ACP thioesterase [Treponema sp.]|jgi:acyl-ACP thioesterase|nr:acyl-ACP thioesterase [Treponema sp.]